MRHRFLQSEADRVMSLYGDDDLLLVLKTPVGEGDQVQLWNRDGNLTCKQTMNEADRVIVRVGQ